MGPVILLMTPEIEAWMLNNSRHLNYKYLGLPCYLMAQTLTIPGHVTKYIHPHTLARTHFHTLFLAHSHTLRSYTRTLGLPWMAHMLIYYIIFVKSTALQKLN